MTFTCTAFLATTLLLSAAPADDWPEFRGPNGDGVVKDGKLPTEWGPDKNVVWKQAVDGNGCSAVLMDDALIFTCDGGRDPFIAALDKNNGKVLWKTERKLGDNQTFSFGTPLVITVKDQRQVVSPTSNGVAAYDPADG